MRTLGCFIFCLLVAALTGCGYRIVRDAAAGPTPTPEPTPPNTLVGQRGVTMPYRKALGEIAFHPFVPSNRLLEVAVLPALKGDEDVRGKRNPHWGIGFEYRPAKVRYALSEWPQNSAPLGFGAGRRLQENGCSMTVYKPDGVLWTSKHGLAMTLQQAVPRPPPPKEEGKETPKPLPTERPASTRDVVNEARRLARIGACG